MDRPSLTSSVDASLFLLTLDDADLCLDDLSYYVWRFGLSPRLDVHSLLALGCTCTRWKTLSNADYVWFPLCKTLWDQKQNLSGDAFLLTKDQPFREAYFTSQDAAKSVDDLLTADLMSQISWGFTFNWVHRLNGGMSPALKPELRPRFLNGSFLYVHPGFSVMRWRFIHDEDLGHIAVQVERFPVLEASRTEDWGIRLRNRHATFESQGLRVAPPAGLKPVAEDEVVFEAAIMRDEAEHAANVIASELYVQRPETFVNLLRQLIGLVAVAPSPRNGGGSDDLWDPVSFERLIYTLEEMDDYDQERLPCGCLHHHLYES